MATVQKSISESSSYTTRTLTTTISAPGIRQNAEISVSPSVDASKVSYVINEAAGTITVTLTNVRYTRNDSYSYNYTEHYPLVNEYTTPDSSGDGYFRHCIYSNGAHIKIGGQEPSFPAGPCPSSQSAPATGYVSSYYFGYSITVEYKTFPEFTVKANSQKGKSVDGWAKINDTKRQLVKFWVRMNGQLKEV